MKCICQRICLTVLIFACHNQLAATSPASNGSWQFRAAGLSYISDVLVKPNGEVFIASAPDGAVIQLDATGNLAQEISTRGPGPGELMGPVGLDYLPANDTLVIADARKLKLLHFGSDGRFLNAWPVPHIQLNGRMFGDGLIAFTTDQLAVPKPNQGVTLYRFDLAASEDPSISNQKNQWRTLLEFDAKAHADPQKMPGKGNNFIRFPWAPRVLVAKAWDDRHLIIGSNVNVDFAWVDVKKGEVTGRIKHDFPRLPLTTAEIDDHLRQRANRLRASYRATQFKNPEFKPVTERINADLTDRLWIKLQRPFQVEESRHVVFSKDGAKVGQILLPANVKVINANTEFVWLSYFDEQSDAWTVEKRAFRLTPIAEK